MSIENVFYTYLTSQQTAQTFLHQCYQQLGDMGAEAESKSYENFSAFMYYLDHGKRFYEIGNNVDLFAKPVLYFYGLTHLLKACLLTKRPDYPESTTLLSHGVTARKRKRKDYTFLVDEVKIQQKGLFPYFSEHLFLIKNLPFEKISMENLLSAIPEMDSLFSLQNNKKMDIVGSTESLFLKFPSHILDNYHLTEKAFINRIQNYLPKIQDIDIDQASIQIQLEKRLPTSNGPFVIHMKDKTIYFPNRRDYFLPISEVMVHYLLLYNLSMLCRYEAEWWGDLLTTKSDTDYPFILQFLEITAKKIPAILEEELYMLINHS